MMGMSYTKSLFLFSPVIFLLIVSQLKDRYEPKETKFKSHNWPLRPGIYMIAFFACIQVLVSHWGIVPILKSYEPNPINFEIVSSLGLMSGLVVICIFMHYIYKVSIIEVFALKRINLSFILAVGTVFIAIYILLIEIMNYQFINIHQREGGLFEITGRKFVLIGVSNLIIIPAAEEFTFRGLLYSPLLRKMGKSIAIILTSLIWAQQHFETPGASLGIFVIGIFLAYYYDKHGTLTSPIIMHSFKNLLTAIIYFRTTV